MQAGPPQGERSSRACRDSAPGRATVERGAAVLKAPDTRCDPEPERRDVIEHRGAEGGHGVFDAGWDLGEDLARYVSVALQAAECLRQGLLADAADLVHDAREAHGLAGFGDHTHGPERPFVRDAGDHLAGERILGFGQRLAEILDVLPAEPWLLR